MLQRSLSILWDSDDLLVTHLEGGSRALGVSFSGIGFEEGAVQKPEFVATASMEAVEHAVFVIDRRRSWFSAEGIQARIVAVVGALIARLKIATVHCIGHSMGGFGALAFADRLGADFAIAMAPQFSMDPAIIAEPRWARWRPGIAAAGLPRLAETMAGRARYYLFFGDTEREDHQHRRLFAKQGRGRIAVLRDTDHHVGLKLQALGLLQPIKTAIANHNHNRLDALLKPHLASGKHFDGKEDRHDQV